MRWGKGIVVDIVTVGHEVCTFAITLPAWFLWVLSGFISISLILSAVKAVLDYKLKRLRTVLENNG